MYTAKVQYAYDDEPFHSTPIFNLADIICEGSDTEETPEQIKQKHLRYEANAKRCASGKLPVLQSTVLRGSFSSSWANPWRFKSIKVHGERKVRQPRPEKLSSNGGSVPRKAAISNSDYISPNDTLSFCRASRGEKENEADASEADREIIQLAKGRGIGNISSDTNKEPCKMAMEDIGLSYNDNDTTGFQIKRGVKRHRKPHTFKNIKLNEYANLDNKSFSLQESFWHLVKKRNSRNGEFEAELLEDQSPLIMNQNKTFDTRKLFFNSRSSSSSPFSSPVSAPKRQRIKYKTKTYKDKFSDIQSDDCDSENSNSIRLNRKLSIYATIRQNSIITPKINHILPSRNYNNLKSVDQDIFIANCSPSSRALEKFVYKTKKRKRDSRGLYDFSDLAYLPSEDSGYSLARKKKKFRMTQDNEEDSLSLDTVDIQRARQEFSFNSEYSLNIINQPTNSKIFPEPQPSKNSSDNNQRYSAGYFQSISDSTEDKIAWRQDYGYEGTPVTPQGEKVLSQSFLQNNVEQSLHTSPISRSKEDISNSNFLTPDEKVIRSSFTQRFIQKPRTYQESPSKFIPKKSAPETENGFQGFLASSVTSSPPQIIKSDSNIFSTSASDVLSQQQINQESSHYLTATGSQKLIERPSLSSLSVPIIYDRGGSSPIIQFSTHRMPESSSVTSSVRDRASRLSMNQRLSSPQILNLSPCRSHSLEPGKYNDSIVPEMIISEDYNEKCNVSLPQSSEKEFYVLEDEKKKGNVKQDECKKPTEAPSTEQQEVSLCPLLNQENAKMFETFPSSSKPDTPPLSILNPVKANSECLKSNYPINKSNQVMIGTPNLSEDKSQNSGHQSPWAPEIQALSINSDGPKNLPDSAHSSLRYDVMNIYVSPESSTIEDKNDINTTPENKVILSRNSNAIETPHLDSQNIKIQKSFESAMKNPWRSSIKKLSSVKSKKRVSFQHSTNLKEDFPSERHSASPPNNSFVGSSSLQPDQMINLPLSIKTPNKSFSENIPNLNTLSKSYSHSQANCSPRFSAMAEAFIAADKQTYSEEKEDEPSLLKDQMVLSSNYNDNDSGQLVTKTTTTKEPNTSNEMNNHDFNISISTSTNAINGNEQKELQSNCWLDSPSFASLKDIDFSILAAENNTTCDPLLSGVEDFLEDWSIDNVLK
ncbi:putative protamine p1 [Erysiphe neolycopersici]|uniref:Putative protamine p1 n=1 Tax=Erysiphe neolycopersici TaxID=212602 RepID=A0A420HJP8_9PEZI|nr:putative protamine p1 [Erysiphe neolycopersici]